MYTELHLQVQEWTWISAVCLMCVSLTLAYNPLLDDDDDAAPPPPNYSYSIYDQGYSEDVPQRARVSGSFCTCMCVLFMLNIFCVSLGLNGLS